MSTLTVSQVNRLLGINLYDTRSFRADVRIDFDESGNVLRVTLLNPAAEMTEHILRLGEASLKVHHPALYEELRTKGELPSQPDSL
jgi:uncharacterized protein YuzE